MTAMVERLRGGGLFARAIRGSAWIAMGYGASQVLRLGANLILTRLLFPEAFGLMAIVTVFIVGLGMFSDMGIAPSIAHHKRGDDPDFLNTAWTIQVIRGFVLWLASVALAWPVAAFYGEPQILWLLPLAGAALAVAGFDPTRIETAHRHLNVGLVTRLDLVSQVIGITAMVALAAATGSVAALVWGNLIGVAVRLVLMHLYLPGEANRFRWEPAAARDLIGYGKWIFLSTVCAFFASQGDKAILGKALSLGLLGIYNIGFFLASFPVLLGQAVMGRVLIPVYRDWREGNRPEDARKLRLMRAGMTSGLMGMLALLAIIGLPLVDLLYDARYVQSGAVVVAVAIAQMPLVLGMSYDHAALAAGDSRGYFGVALVRAMSLTGLLLIGAMQGGLPGAILGMGAAGIVTHLFTIRLGRKHGVWDARHDIGFTIFALGVGGTALWRQWPAITALGG